MGVLLSAVLLGIVAGMRTMTAPAAARWAAALGYIDLGGTWLQFLGHPVTPWILTVMALGEFVTDQLPTTPSRTVPVQFGARLVSGALVGSALGLAGGSLAAGVTGGVAGAIAGTLGGRWFRGRLAAAFGSDRPAAFIEDAVAVVLAAVVVTRLS